VGVLRAILDRSNIQDYPLKSLISEELVNTIKWVVPGLLLFDGCRTRRRVVVILVCVLSVYFLISVQVIRLLPLESILQSGDSIEYTRQACTKMGYNATDLSVMFAGASLGFLAIMPLFHKKYRIVMLISAGVVLVAQALTGGRGGYLAWGATGLVLCVIRWRKYLILVPVVAMLLPMVFPGAVGRMLVGFGGINAAGQTTVDDYSMTSGRTLIWPHVVDRIGESPLVGHGRLAMRRTGLTAYLLQEYGEGEAVYHPHNIYLETLLDNGILGSLPIFILWGIIILYSTRLFGSNNQLYSAVGGLCLALILTSLIGGLSGQHYYPQEHTVGMWMAVFLMLRVDLEEKRAQAGVTDAKDSWNSQVIGQHVAIG
jgi:O-antigen ligase